MFPGGRPGFALLLLRVSTTATPLIAACEPLHVRPTWCLWALFALGAALCAGFLTNLAALLSVAIQLLAFNAASAYPVWLGASLLNALSLALIGPGAYSLDALRFGRRLLMSNRRR
jgi:hypothetical protein